MRIDDTISYTGKRLSKSTKEDNHDKGRHVAHKLLSTCTYFNIFKYGCKFTYDLNTSCENTKFNDNYVITNIRQPVLHNH